MNRINLFFIGLVASAGCMFGSASGAYASGDYLTFWAAPNSQCAKASRPTSAIKDGTVCRATVNFAWSACQNGQALTTCFTDNRPVHIWLERRVKRGLSWQKTPAKRVFDFSNVNEFIDFRPSKTYDYRVAFEYFGQEAFADDYSRTFTVNVKPR